MFAKSSKVALINDNDIMINPVRTSENNDECL